MPSSASAVRAGFTFVEIGARDDQLRRALRRAQQRLRAFGAAMQQVGTRLVTLGVTAAMPLALATKTYAGFEQQMARVKALTGATEQDFKRLSAEAKRLGGSTVFSASQAAEAMGSFALAGFDVHKIMTAMEPTLNLAAAGQLEIGEAADIATKIMAGMGIEASDLGGAIDVLAKAMTTATTDLGQLGDAMKFVGPIAKSAGVAFEEVVAAIQLLSNAGIQGEMAGTTLRGAILALTSPSSEAASVMQELGVQVNDAEGNVRPLVDIIADLGRSMDGMGSGKRLEILGRIFPARTAAGMAELLSQGSDKLEAFTDTLRNSGGTAKRIADTQLNTLTGSFLILRSAVEAAGIAIGESYKAPLRAVMAVMTDVVNQTTEWVTANGDLVAMAAAAVVGVTALGAGLITLGLALKTAAFSLGVFMGLLKVVPATLMLILSPMGLIVTAAGIAALAFVDWQETVDGALDGIAAKFRWLRGNVREVIGGITDALSSGNIELAVDVMWKGLKVTWLEGTDSIRSWWNDLMFDLVDYLAVAESAINKIVAEIIYLMTSIKDRSQLAVEYATKRAAVKAHYKLAYFVSSSDEAREELEEMEIQELGKLGEWQQERDKELREKHRKMLENLGTLYDAYDKVYSDQYSEAFDEREQKRIDAARQLQEAIDELQGSMLEAESEADRVRAQAEEAAAASARQRKQAKESAAARQAEFDELMEGVNRRIASSSSVVGTFNIAALAGLGYSGVQERTARATEATAKYAKWMADDARHNRATFT